MTFFNSPGKVISASIALRAALLVYGAWQDAHSPIKYTDIDYLVFTDAARYVSRGASPYARDTYRYTPLLSWLLVPTTWELPGFFSFGKALFALSDVVAGWLIFRLLVSAYGMSRPRAIKYASVWLLNPMVANISTRGSSEGLLGVLVVGLVWAVLTRRVTIAGVILGLGVHFKIYPFVYGVAILWWMDQYPGTGAATASREGGKGREKEQDFLSQILNFFTPARIHLTLVALATFSALNISMYILYGFPFAQHTYLHHLTRIDHRHNFSPYSTLLYLSAAGGGSPRGFAFESLAFIPQLLLSVVIIPLVLGKKSLAGTMLAQTFAFVTFNKVCTSQYFLWYLIFLPFYLPSSSLMKDPRKGVMVGLLWVLAQALWLQQGYNLEFLGLSSFVPGLFLASLFFFVVNVWILGIIVEDVGAGTATGSA